ncbi:MAG: glycosyltransferase family 9 protein [Sedimentisphaerales bacterium]|nr:glycosyltransferase family 9 protein [Sedimentisphaerales bacterium]
MSGKSNIIDELRKKLAKAALAGERGVILQPGSLGDCILTLPLAELMKETVCPGGVDIIGRTEYTGFLPGRSCVDGVRAMDSMGLHRLFVGEKDFALADGDPLITAFAEYPWIVTFLGEPDGDFERNLIFTAHCSHGAEVITLAMKPAVNCNKHIGDFYREQFIKESGLAEEKLNSPIGMPMIRPTDADMKKGKQILAEAGVTAARKPIVIQPGSGGAEKCWNIDNFVSIAETLAKEGIETVFILGPAELERFGTSVKSKMGTAGKTLANLSLTEALAVLSNAAGYIGNDSGITHLSAALGIKTVAVFGPTDPAVYGPIGPAITALQSSERDFAGTISEELQKKAAEALVG